MLERTAVLLTLATLGPIAAVAESQDLRDAIGLTALERRLGEDATPTGAGVRVAVVEAADPQTGGYAPLADGAAPVVRRSGPGLASAHATEVVRLGFGAQEGVAPGVESIEVFHALHWLARGFLNGPGPILPGWTSAKVLNHSWVGQAGGNTKAYLRKLDFAIGSQGLVVVGGVNNGGGALDSPLLSHAFNGVTVGRRDGRHESGATRFGLDGPGRSKPEIVAPAPATSWATPIVSGALALLVETARTHPRVSGDPDAERPEVLKAALLAGARHAPDWGNDAPVAGGVRGAAAHPLDPQFGAGELDVDDAHWILSAGRAPTFASPVAALGAAPAGWSRIDLESGESAWVVLDVEAHKDHLSAVATWRREVASDFASWSMPDVDLRLWALDGSGGRVNLVGTPAGAYFAGGNVLSDGLDDNLEHLFVRGLTPGRYALEVRRTIDALGPWSVALAWHVPCAPTSEYGRGKPSATGRRPRLAARGRAARFASGLRLELEGAPPGALPVLLRGRAPAHLPVAGAALLVGGELERRALATRVEPDGRLVIDLAIAEEDVGRTFAYQVLLRDPSHPDGSGLGATNAVLVSFCR